MSATPNSTIGVKDLVTAELTADTTLALTYGTVEAVSGAIKIDIKDDSGKPEEQWFDDALGKTMYSLPQIKFSLENADITPEMQAKFFGHSTDVNGVVVVHKDDEPPFRAFGFKSKKADNTYRYVWLLKCRPDTRTQDSTHQTEEGDKVNPQTGKIDFTGYARIYDGYAKFAVDDDNASFSSAKATFFDAPYTAGVSPAITISVQPVSVALTAGAISGSLDVTASITGGGAITYLWYSNTTNSVPGGTACTTTGYNTNSFTIPIDLTAGTYYYYCKLSSANAVTVYTKVALVIVAAGG
jgi:phi13 family phage major tail protein